MGISQEKASLATLKIGNEIWFLLNILYFIYIFL